MANSFLNICGRMALDLSFRILAYWIKGLTRRVRINTGYREALRKWVRKTLRVQAGTGPARKCRKPLFLTTYCVVYCTCIGILQRNKRSGAVPVNSFLSRGQKRSVFGNGIPGSMIRGKPPSAAMRASPVMGRRNRVVPRISKIRPWQDDLRRYLNARIQTRSR